MSTNFNPRSREGSDSLAVVQVIISALISIHAPARGATLLDRKSIDFRQNFNPRSREGSDFLLSVLIVQFRISIHAPARGATRVRLVCCRRLAISIHAPARGATAPAQTVKSYTVDFNPRSREGSDHTSHNGGIFVIISIHAPARGATSPIFLVFHHLVISIHAPARGATLHPV